MRTDELDFLLPPELIATRPAEPRDDARLMVCIRGANQVLHRKVRDLPSLELFKPGDLMVVNETTVLPALLEGERASSGGRVSGLYLQTVSEKQPTLRWRVMLESGGHLLPGERVNLRSASEDGTAARWGLQLQQNLGGGEWLAEVTDALCNGENANTAAVLQEVGRTPLPPYLRKARERRHEVAINDDDFQRYNTVYRDPAQAGSVAAPTAGLHFTPRLLDVLAAQGLERVPVTLHVGRGTFLPVKAERLADHPMHEESWEVGGRTLQALRQVRRSGGRILAIGTPSVRTLDSLPSADELLSMPEAAALWSQGMRGETSLMISPGSGHVFQFTDRLLTNFHLPRSTLLALVAALPGVGLPRLLDWYRQAVEQGYRFYSYGDAMLII